MKTIPLGTWVNDIVTGFTGTAIFRAEMLSGTVQIAVQPRIKDGETVMPDPMLIDNQTLVVMDNHLWDMVVPPDEVNLPLGIKVRDTVTGVTGITIEKQIHLNGCTRYVIQPPYVEGLNLLGDAPGSMNLDWKRLEPVSLKVKHELSAATAAASAVQVGSDIADGIKSKLSGLSGMFTSAEVTAEPAVEPLTTTKVGKGGPNRRAERF